MGDKLGGIIKKTGLQKRASRLVPCHTRSLGLVRRTQWAEPRKKRKVPWGARMSDANDGLLFQKKVRIRSVTQHYGARKASVLQVGNSQPLSNVPRVML
jgi:hypothetical protein